MWRVTWRSNSGTRESDLVATYDEAERMAAEITTECPCTLVHIDQVDGPDDRQLPTEVRGAPPA